MQLSIWIHKRSLSVFGFGYANRQNNYLKILVKKKEHTTGLFIDFAIGFDTVSHSVLTTKLAYYGIMANFLKLIQSYLANRKQTVTCYGINTILSNVKYGLRQWSILGNLLFFIYINYVTVTAFSQVAFRIMFADATNLFFTKE